MTEQVVYLNRVLFKNKTNGYFVDIGANDGEAENNTLYLEQILKWNGICIEPIPDIFEKLKANRKCECLNAAITDKTGYAEFLYLRGKHQPGMYLDFLSGILNKYDKRHIERIDEQ